MARRKGKPNSSDKYVAAVERAGGFVIDDREINGPVFVIDRKTGQVRLARRPWYASDVGESPTKPGPAKDP